MQLAQVHYLSAISRRLQADVQIQSFYIILGLGGSTQALGFPVNLELHLRGILADQTQTGGARD